MRHVLFLFLFVSPALADNSYPRQNNQPDRPMYYAPQPNKYIMPIDPNRNTGVDPTTGNQYIFIAPNVILDPNTGQQSQVVPLN